MARIEKTVFISYRRSDVYTALAVYENLKNQGYDVFFDYRSISSGDFEQIINSNIRARAHFLIILTPTALDRCSEAGDWLRREIELAIEEKRNIIPLLFKEFRFGTPSVSEKLTGKLKNLSRYNGLNVHEDYFEEAMHRLRTQFLNKPLNTVLHPVSTEVQKVVKAEQVAADEALKRSEDVKELVKQAGEKPAQERQLPKPVAAQALKSETTHHTPLKVIPWRLIAGIAGGLLLITLCIWGGLMIFNNIVNGSATNTPPVRIYSSSSPDPMNVISGFATQTAMARRTNTPSKSMSTVEAFATQSAIPQLSFTPALGIGSTMTGTDGMTLLYVPAGEFTMGSDNGEANEKPVHTVNLDAFWIDETEVTNAMYAKCVDAGICDSPGRTNSNTHDSYYGNPEFDNYPVIYVDWNMAKTYCELANRRLPTEAEWEKAARGINGNLYPWGNGVPNNNLLNFNKVVGDTTEVGTYPYGVSPYGAYDMAGNVLEWVSSLYKSYPYDSVDGREDLISLGTRALRGGSWVSNGELVRSSKRSGNDRSYIINS